MSPVFAARRRAEEFNSLVEGTSTRELHDARTMELTELVGALRQAPAAAPRPEFVSGLRERLMAEAATALVPAARDAATEADARLTVAPRRSPRERRIAAAVGGIAIVGATTSMAVAAQSALPGDTLYPLKRAIENAQTGFTVSDGQRGTALLDNASGRLNEVQALSTEDGATTGSVETIELTFADFIDQANAASELLIADYEENGSADAIAELRDFTASSMAALSELEAVLPAGARAALIQAAQVLTQIDAHAAALCSVCGGEGISVIPPFAVRAVEEFVGGLAGALTRPLQTVGDLDRPAAGVRKGDGKAGRGDKNGATTDGGSAGSGQQAQPTAPSQPAPGGDTGGDQTGSDAGTLGDVVGGVLGGGTDGKASTSPTPVPEVVEDVVEGVGDAVDGVVDGVGDVLGESTTSP